MSERHREGNLMRVLSIGEILWDHLGDRRTLGGAPLNISAHLAQLGNTVAILSAVGADPEAVQACKAVSELGVDLRWLQSTSSAPTGSAFVSSGVEEPPAHISRPAAYDFLNIDPATRKAILSFQPDWLYLGTLFHVRPAAAQRTLALRQSLPRARVFYDVNLRAGNWAFPLVQCLSHTADIVKMNDVEARLLATLGGFTDWERCPEHFCTDWLEAFQLECVCVTLGANGCLVATEDGVEHFGSMPVTAMDTLGAGDAFSAGFLHGWHQGWTPEECSRLANLLGAMVASKAGAIPDWSHEERGVLREYSRVPQREQASC